MGLSLTNVNDCYQQQQQHWHTEILEKIPPHLEWRISKHPRVDETTVRSHLRMFPQSMGDGDRMMKIAATCCCHWCQCTRSEEISCSKLYQRDNIFRINAINTLFSKSAFHGIFSEKPCSFERTHMACLQVSTRSTFELLILMFLQYLLQFS